MLCRSSVDRCSFARAALISHCSSQWQLLGRLRASALATYQLSDLSLQITSIASSFLPDASLGFSISSSESFLQTWPFRYMAGLAPSTNDGDVRKHQLPSPYLPSSPPFPLPYHSLKLNDDPKLLQPSTYAGDDCSCRQLDTIGYNVRTSRLPLNCLRRPQL